METWTKHDKDIDSPTLVPRRIRAIRVRGRRLGNSPDKLITAEVMFEIAEDDWERGCDSPSARHARQFQREQPQARILNGLEVLTSCLQMRVKYAVKLKRD